MPTPAEILARLIEAGTPPHPLAAEVPPPEPDPEQAAAVERILALVDPPATMLPISMSQAGFERLPTFRKHWAYRDPVPKPWRPWRAFLVLLREEHWHVQFVPHRRGALNGCRLVFRRVRPFPPGSTPVTLDDLAAEVEAARANKTKPEHQAPEDGTT